MGRVFNRIKISFIPTLGKQILKVIVFCILFSMFLSTLTIKQLGKQFSKYIYDKINLTTTVYSQIGDSSSVDKNYSRFIHNRDIVINYFDKTIYYVKTVNDIATTNNCSYQLEILCDFIKPHITNGKLSSTDCIALSENQFNTLRGDNNQYNDNYICILPEGSTIIYTDQNGSYIEKEVQIGDSINLNYLIGYGGTAYLGYGQGEIISKDISFTIVGFTNDEIDNSFNVVSPIYIPINCFLEIAQDCTTTLKNDEQLNMNCPYTVSETSLNCDNLDQYISVMKQLKNSANSDIYYTSDASEMSGLLSIASAIDSNINEVTFIITLLMVLATIITAFLTLYIRRKEIGLLSSFGEDKKHICLQIIVEQILITIFAIPLSLFVQKKLAKKILTYLSLNNSLQIEAMTMYFSQRVTLNLTVNDYLCLSLLTLSIIFVYGTIIYLTVQKNDPKKLLKG